MKTQATHKPGAPGRQKQKHKKPGTTRTKNHQSNTNKHDLNKLPDIIKN